MRGGAVQRIHRAVAGSLWNIWKLALSKNPWFKGGNLHQLRHCSKNLGLQLEAKRPCRREFLPAYSASAKEFSFGSCWAAGLPLAGRSRISLTSVPRTITAAPHNARAGIRSPARRPKMPAHTGSPA